MTEVSTPIRGSRHRPELAAVTPPLALRLRGQGSRAPRPRCAALPRGAGAGERVPSPGPDRNGADRLARSLAGAEAEDESTRAAATIKHAGCVPQAARGPDAARWPAAPTIIPVTGGHYEVRFGERGATLRHVSPGRDGDAEA